MPLPAIPIGAAILGSTAIATGAAGAAGALSAQQQRESAARRAKEMKRETLAALIQEALQRDAEMEAQRLKGTSAMTKRKAHNLQETADLIRGAFGI